MLSRDAGFRRNHGRNPYAGYGRVDNPPFLFRGDLDGRLPPKERVAAFTVGDVDVAFPFSALKMKGWSTTTSLAGSRLTPIVHANHPVSHSSDAGEAAPIRYLRAAPRSPGLPLRRAGSIMP